MADETGGEEGAEDGIAGLFAGEVEVPWAPAITRVFTRQTRDVSEGTPASFTFTLAQWHPLYAQ